MGSALAAVSAAFFASWAGTAGTLIGAALGSVFATAGSATYTWWLRRTSDVVRRTAAHVRETGMGSTVVMPGLRTRGAPGDSESDSEGDSEAESDVNATEDGTSADSGSGSDRWAFLRGRPWGKVLLVSLGVMVVALAGITLVEAVTGKPLSAITRGDHSKGVSITRIVGDDGGPARPKKKHPTPGRSPSPAPTPSATTPPTPGATPSTSPTATPSESPTPTPSATATPSPSASPQGAPPADGGTQPGTGGSSTAP
jgi:hypothetical protein